MFLLFSYYMHLFQNWLEYHYVLLVHDTDSSNGNDKHYDAVQWP